MRTSVRHKLFSLVALAALPGIATVGLTLVQRDSVGAVVGEGVEELGLGYLQQVAGDVVTACASAHPELQAQVDANLRVATHLVAGAGGVAPVEETASWDAIDQFTRQTRRVELPRLAVGGVPVPLSRNPAVDAGLVDRITDVVGGTATLFQRMNDEGDLLRVSTNVLTLDRNRATGTYIPAVQPDGSRNAVVEAVLSGDTYRGRAFVVNAWYLTAYHPLFDGNGRIVAALYVGVPLDAALARVRDRIEGTRIGDGGHVVVYRGSGDERGKVVVSPGARWDGEIAWGEVDADGEPWLPGVVESARDLDHGEVGLARVRLAGDVAGEVVPTSVAYAYFEPWDWVVTTRIPDASLFRAETESAAAFDRMALWIIGAGLVGFLAMLGLALIMGRQLTAPLQRLVAASKAVADGDLDDDVDVVSSDEIGDVGRSLQAIVEAQRERADAACRIAAGDLSSSVSARSDRDRLGHAMASMHHAVEALVRDVSLLAEGAVAGKLDRRVDASRHEGRFHEIVAGMHRTLDAVAAPVTEARRVLERVAERDLSVRMTGRHAGDYAKIHDSLNHALDELEASFEEVASSAAVLRQRADDIAGHAARLAEGATDNASSLEEVSSSLSQLVESTRGNAEGASEARALVDEARGSADRGAASVDGLSRAMERIAESARATARIVAEIDGIASQTNLLALNAAVEAARAGERGRGFAVVADEVRNLASRSASSAHHTGEMIDQAVSSAEEGGRLHGDVVEGLQQIVGHVSRVGEVVVGVALASEHQNESVQQIDTAVERMNRRTQEAAQSSRESAGAATSLSEEAQRMERLVGRFTLRRRAIPEPAPSPEPAAEAAE